MNSPVAPGDVLDGKYRVERIIGAGGMGIVVQAFHEKLEQRVAIKFLLPSMKDNVEIVTRFAREARAAARIKSDHVARVIDVSSLPDGSPYMVMEYLEGQDLRQILRERGPFPVQFLSDCIMQALDALSDAHRVGVVHRDLKPANLFLAKVDGEQTSIKVLDFGISKLQNDTNDPSLTSDVAMLGSPIYMAPEQVRMSREVDHRADIWSVGATMYELATGIRPFPREAIAQMVTAILFDAAVPPSQIRPGLPPAFDALILRCLEKDPMQRFATCGELALALAPLASPQASILLQRICRVGGTTSSRATRPPELEAMLSRLNAGTTGPAATTPTIPPKAGPAPSRGPGLAVAFGVGAAITVVAIAALGYRHFVPAAAPPTPSVQPVRTAPPAPSESTPPAVTPRPPTTGAAATPDASTPPVASAPVAVPPSTATTAQPTASAVEPATSSTAAPTATQHRPVATAKPNNNPPATATATARPKSSANTMSGFGPRD